MKSPVIKFSIANQIRFGLSFIVLVGLLFMAGVLILYSYRLQMNSAMELQEQRTALAAAKITNYMSDLKTKLSFLTRMRGLSTLAPEDQKNLIETLIRHNNAYESLTLLDANAKSMSHVSKSGVEPPKLTKKSPSFSFPFHRGEEHLGNVRIDPQSHDPVLLFAAPIRDLQDNIDGVIVTRINLKFLWVIINSSRVGVTGTMYVFDHRKLQIARLGADPKHFEINEKINDSLAESLHSGTFDPQEPYTGLSGAAVFGAVREVPDMGWFVAAELPVSEVYAPIQRMFQIMLGILIVSALVSLATGIAFAKNIVRPLGILTNASAAVSAGQLRQEVRIESENELGILASAFNHMTRQVGDLVESLASANQRLELLLDSARRINAGRDGVEVLTGATREILREVLKKEDGLTDILIREPGDKRERFELYELNGTQDEAQKAPVFKEMTDFPEYANQSACFVRDAELCIPIGQRGRPLALVRIRDVGEIALESEDERFINTLTQSMAVALDNIRINQNLEALVQERTQRLETAMKALWGEMELAKRIQTVLLPPNPTVPGYEISAVMQTAEQVGGDYYDVINGDGNGHWLVIGDVSGHGVPAGLVMMMAQTAIHTVLSESSATDPAQLLARVNQVITENVRLMSDDKFMTIMVLNIQQNGQCIYVGRHLDMYVHRKKEDRIECFRTHGAYIGLKDNIRRSLRVSTLELELGDTLLLYTDGVIEAKDPASGRRFDPEGLERAFLSLASHTPAEIQNGVLEKLKDYRIDDDMSMMVIRRLL